MGFFGKTRKVNGLLALGFDAGGVCAARITRVPDNKPVVEMAAYFPCKHPLASDALDKMGRELHAAQYACSS